MIRRLSRPVAAALLTAVLCLSAPSAFAAPSQGGGWDDPIFYGPRIVQFFRTLVHHFIPGSQSDFPIPPIP